MTSFDGVNVDIEWIRHGLISPLTNLLNGQRLLRLNSMSASLQLFLAGIRELDTETQSHDDLESSASLFDWPIRIYLQSSIVLAHIAQTDLESAANWIKTMLDQRQQLAKRCSRHFRAISEVVVLSMLLHYCVQAHKTAQALKCCRAIQRLCVNHSDLATLLHFVDVLELLLKMSNSASAHDSNHTQVSMKYLQEFNEIAQQSEALLDTSVSGCAKVAAGLACMLSGDDTLQDTAEV